MKNVSFVSARRREVAFRGAIKGISLEKLRSFVLFIARATPGLNSTIKYYCYRRDRPRAYASSVTHKHGDKEAVLPAINKFRTWFYCATKCEGEIHLIFAARWSLRWKKTKKMLVRV
jgi:hypothetical protein